MLNEYKLHLKEQARVRTEKIASAFKLTEEKRQKMEDNHYQAKLQRLNECLKNGIIFEKDIRRKVKGIVKLNEVYYFVTEAGICPCDEVLDYFKY